MNDQDDTAGAGVRWADSTTRTFSRSKSSLDHSITGCPGSKFSSTTRPSDAAMDRSRSMNWGAWSLGTYAAKVGRLNASALVQGLQAGQSDDLSGDRLGLLGSHEGVSRAGYGAGDSRRHRVRRAGAGSFLGLAIPGGGRLALEDEVSGGVCDGVHPGDHPRSILYGRARCFDSGCAAGRAPRQGGRAGCRGGGGAGRGGAGVLGVVTRGSCLQHGVVSVGAHSSGARGHDRGAREPVHGPTARAEDRKAHQGHQNHGHHAPMPGSRNYACVARNRTILPVAPARCPGPAGPSGWGRALR